MSVLRLAPVACAYSPDHDQMRIGLTVDGQTRIGLIVVNGAGL
jgi:hypothetical protein